MWQLANTEQDKALARLAIGAFFFAMRSCEYLKVRGPRKTKLLTLGNIRFRHKRVPVAHSDPRLHLSTVVSITFVSQKNGKKDTTITMYRTEDDILCPVKAWAAIVKHLLLDPATRSSTPINACRVPPTSTRARTPGKRVFLSGDDMITAIRTAASTIGENHLGFTVEELGTHSIRSGAAMAMHLAHVPSYTIMLIGRWSSDAFLRYIRVQVMQFAQNVSGRMITNQDFYSIPHYDPKMDVLDVSQVTRAAPSAAPSQTGGRVRSAISTSLARTPARTAFYLFS
jgi:hypothetical protein